MERPWSQDYACPAGHRFNLIIEHRDRELPQKCDDPDCVEMAMPTFSVPRNLRRSYHDGVVRPGLRKLAEASNIEAESFNLPPSERKAHEAEIKKLRKADT